jgi:hypothetical protein
VQNLQLLIFGISIALLTLTCQQSAPIQPEQGTPAGKGYEMYSWVENTTRYYTIITGTNRLKTFQEIHFSSPNIQSNEWLKVTVTSKDSLPRHFNLLPNQSVILWYGKSRPFGDISFTYPSEEDVTYILDQATSMNIKIYLTDP